MHVCILNVMHILQLFSVPVARVVASQRNASASWNTDEISGVRSLQKKKKL